MPVTDLVYTLAIVAAVLVAFAWFVHLERQDRSVTVVLFLVGVLIADSVLYQSQNNIPAGLFHPTVATVSFRLPDLLIPAALFARLITHGLPKRLDASVLAWLVFVLWLLMEAVNGVFIGNPPGHVAYHAKLVAYLAIIALAAGVPLTRYLEDNRLLHLVWASAAAAALLLVLDSLGVVIDVHIPGLPLPNFGIMGSDAATIFVSLGLVALAVGAVSERRRFSYLVPAAPLLITPLAANQRAAILGLVVSLLILVAAAPLSRARLRITPTETVVTILVVLACVLTPAVSQLAVANRLGELPWQKQLTEQFSGREVPLTDADRLNQWYVVRKLVAQRPLFGWGLGKEFVYYEPGFQEFQQFDSVHNIGGDLLLRTGGIGLLLFLAALATTTAGGLFAWRRSDDDVISAIAIALVAATGGLLAKGMVEDLFEKYRLAALLALLFGMLLAAASTVRATQEAPGRARIDLAATRAGIGMRRPSARARAN
jgi:hypothetical protein